jgi:aldehyde:ferredoxin oxidoreductase
MKKVMITTEDTDGIELELEWRSFIAIIKKIAAREGFGDILAEGSYRALRK